MCFTCGPAAPAAHPALCGQTCCTAPKTTCQGGVWQCPPGTTACRGQCVNTTTDATNCGTCGRSCPAATPTCCAGRCEDLQTDHDHCGRCGTRCGAEQVCCQGNCVGTCSGGQQLNPTTC